MSDLNEYKRLAEASTHGRTRREREYAKKQKGQFVSWLKAKKGQRELKKLVEDTHQAR